MMLVNDRSIMKSIKNFSDRKSTRLNSSHLVISYAVFCLKKKNITDALEWFLLGKIEHLWRDDFNVASLLYVLLGDNDSCVVFFELCYASLYGTKTLCPLL